MPKLKPETQQARRDHILDVAEYCFAENGFHSTSMQIICREAQVSAGALYTHFDSKEALIAGITERDRSEFSDRFEDVARQHEMRDVMTALHEMAAHYFVDEPRHKLAMKVEIGAESLRNDTVRDMFMTCDQTIESCFSDLLARLQREGRIAPSVSTDEATKLLQIIGDGLLWRRAVDPDFDGAALLPNVLSLVTMILAPSDGVSGGDAPDKTRDDANLAMNPHDNATEASSHEV